ncbi:cysteine--tRNA ligase [Rhodopseudomonas palustris]|uniref:cysteine--tRNA ligase n=1 Tax=Rhodopseudomonas palustris TaxID=1076 RepID=UPI0022F0A4A6|nr:cysteine--tRNA ligase [Rhodopseudomonas palustris]WBU31840.1 cysteine--tRNA ligase [Rhodopseudomonas palustris]
MELRLYDTLTRDKRPFTPLDPANVRMYVCGPTVYDFAHIGNARPVIVFDVLFRLLRHLYGEAHVKYVRNITDVDDKINDRAARDYPGLPLNEAIRKVTEQTERQFHDDVDALGCLRPTVEPRATEHIGEMRSIIEKLVAGGFAYVEQDHVLFSPSAMNAANGVLPRYGSLANRSLDEMIAGARVDVAPYKRDATDFVLWKPSKPGEPSWPSPAGIATPGRPGWHIECSAMSWKHLGETFDIHGGGIDLVFPHHENEVAQSCCAFHTSRMAQTWMHNGFLQVEGEKMSKSLGNFVTIRELLRGWRGQAWSGDVVRWAMLQTHYRQPIDWTFDNLLAARNELAEIYIFLRSIDYELSNSGRDVVQEAGNLSPSADVVGPLLDDLNLPGAIASIRSRRSMLGKSRDAAMQVVRDLMFLGVVRSETRYVFGMSSVGQRWPAQLTTKIAGLGFDYRIACANKDEEFVKQIEERAARLGVTIESRGPLDLGLNFVSDWSDQQSIQDLIEARTAARANKDWKESDRIRDELAAMGVVLKDGKDADGKPVTTWELAR